MLSKLRRRYSRKSRQQAIPDDDIQDYYDRLSAEVKEDARAAGWQSTKTQSLRFLVLSLIADLEGERLLDIGCGIGDFYAYLRSQFTDFHYEGIDLSPGMIERAKKKHTDAIFDCQDLFDFSPKKTYDYVFASGALSYKQKNAHDYLKKAIQKLFFLSEKGLAFNLLSEHANENLKIQRRFQHFCPKEVLSIINRDILSDPPDKDIIHAGRISGGWEKVF